MGPLTRISINLYVPHWVKRKSNSLSNAELISFLTQLRQLLDSGLPTSSALLATVDTFRKELFPEVRMIKGQFAKVPEAFDRDARNLKCETLQQLGKLLSINYQLGAPISRSVDLLVTNVLEREANEELLSGEMAGVRATIFVLAGLPLFGIFLGFIMGINIPCWLATNHIGQICLVSALSLEILGILWAKRLIRI